MLRFLLSELRFRRSRLAALAAGVFVAAVGFILLTGSAQTSQLHVRGTLASSFRPAYDILVRPQGSQAPLERRAGLVRPNFLSGIYGGITFSQWRRIESIPGVAIAAPIANIGFLLPLASLPVSLNGVTTGAAHQLYRVDATWVADDGLSRYPQGQSYVYYSPRDRFTQAGSTNPFVERGPDTKPVTSCNGFLATTPPRPTSPFPPLASTAVLSCFPSSRGPNGNTVNGFWEPSPRFVGTDVEAFLPIYVSAIDPVQEAKLLHLDHAIVSGRYLREDEGLVREAGGAFTSMDVPVLASTRSYIDEHLELTVRRLVVPSGDDLPAALAASNARAFAERLKGRVVATRSIPVADFYRRLLTRPEQQGAALGTIFSDAYWTTSPTPYKPLGSDRLAPVPVHNPPQIWQSQFSAWYTPPLDNLDPQFRSLHERVQSNLIVHGIPRFHPLRVVGQFDPSKLPGFSALTRVPLETYQPPSLLPANTAADEALKDNVLEPSQNLGGYIQPPPLLLTNMRGLRTFLDPRNWSTGFTFQDNLNTGANSRAIPVAQRLAPISAIRVKVAEVTGPDSLSLERIKVVAQTIQSETGLAVDITAGSSPHPIDIALPKGNFGRPPLLLEEGWSKKGVTVSFLRALDRKDLALFALVLVICALFLGNGALASVRARRAEIGTLLTIGWTRRAIFRVVLGELLVVGLAAGALGTALAAILVVAFSLHLPLLQVLLVLPIAGLLTLTAGAIPAWLATCGLPLDALRPPVTARTRARFVRRLSALAVVNLARLPGRTAVGAGALAIGVAALSVLLGIEQGFRGTLVGTVLGNAVAVQVRSADLVAVALILVLGALSVADIVYLNLREREAEIVTLRTLGWSERHLRTLVVLESLGIGLLGSIAGAVIAVVIGAALLAIPVTALAMATAAAAAIGTASAVSVSLVPLRQVARLAAPAVLAAE